MIWSDYNFKTYGEDIIKPFNLECLQPNSYELHLDDEIKIATETGWISEKLPFTISQGQFVLASTLEVVRIPQRATGRVLGKSSIARLGMPVEFAGLIDTGFEGQITLEMYVLAHPVELKPKMPIAQLVIEDSYPCDKLYGEYNNHYQHQKGATLSWMDKN